MPVRLRITLLFSFFAFIVLSIVCGGIYYFSYQSRIDAIKTRLTNRAITTARLLSQQEIFDKEVVRRIDSLTTISLQHKVVVAYDRANHRIYRYSDFSTDSLLIDDDVLDKARAYGSYYFLSHNKEAIAYNYSDNNADIVVVTGAEDADGHKNLSNLLKILVASFLVGILLVLAFGYFFSRGLLRPIKKISDDAAEISAQNLTRRIKTGTGKDEWNQLSHTLNELLNRLQESFESQRRFIANASHELSTPLTIISSQLEVSLQRERTADEYKKVMHSIYQDVQHMSKLTQTLLELAKASGNKGGLELSPVRVDEIVLQLPFEMAKLQQHYHVHLQFESLPEDANKLFVFGNETLLLTAFKNIVVNACKYSADHKAVVILAAGNEGIQVTVEDKGVGIPASKLSSVFEPFFRLGDNDQPEGFGLGLSLADRIIKLHKGEISVQSQTGVGTRFTIHLPSAETTAF